ncbi:hypothetical protein SCOR_03920 [Sulfidibacter corallicola]
MRAVCEMYSVSSIGTINNRWFASNSSKRVSTGRSPDVHRYPIPSKRFSREVPACCGGRRGSRLGRAGKAAGPTLRSDSGFARSSGKGAKRISRASGSLDDRFRSVLGSFDWWSKLRHLQTLRPSHDAGFSQIGASMNAWLPTGDASLFKSSKICGYVASIGGASCSTYRPYAPLTMREPWTVGLRWCAVRVMIGFALWCNWLLLLGLLRRVGPAGQPTGSTPLSICGLFADWGFNERVAAYWRRFAL